MKYLCLIYHDEKTVDTLAKVELDALTKECLAFDETLKERARLVTCERLQSVETATTLRLRGGKVLVTDGPFAETKEQLAGFYLIEAADLDDAIRVASRIPPARFGCVEVRPVMEYAD